MMGPIIEELAEEVKDKYKVGKLNVDENRETAAKYGVMSIPTLIIFKDGKEVKQLVGVQSKEEFEGRIGENIINLAKNLNFSNRLPADAKSGRAHAIFSKLKFFAHFL